MRVLGVASLVMDYPFLMKPLMVAGEFTLTSPLFLSLIKGHRPLEPEHSLTYDVHDHNIIKLASYPYLQLS